eukprot:6457449-Amphidinium_carterae.1
MSDRSPFLLSGLQRRSLWLIMLKRTLPTWTRGSMVEAANLVLAYIDFAVLNVPQAIAGAVLLVWQEFFLSIGPELQMSKTVIYQPRMRRPESPLLAAMWDKQPRK